MKNLILTCISVFLSLTAYGRVFEVVYEGNALLCNVISEDAGTCEVSGDDSGKEVSGNLVIPAVVNDGHSDFKVIAIADNAFGYNRKITEVTIADGITSIGDWAFAGCINIKSVHIGNSVESIGEFAFNDCSLRSVVIPSSVTYIGNDAFGSIPGSPSLKEVNTESLASWMKIRFKTNSANPLYYTKKLLLNGELVQDLVIPDGVETVNARAFYNCDAMRSVKFPASVKRIEADAFGSCDNVKRFDFDSLEGYLGMEYPSSECRLPSLSSGRIYIGGEMFRMPDELDWPEDLKRVPPFAFYGEKSLKRVVLPPGVKSIGDKAFYGCSSLQEINIPSTVETIGSEAFDYCKNLGTVSFEGTPVSIDKYAFSSYKFGNPVISDLYLASEDEWSNVSSAGGIIRKDGSLYINGRKVRNLVLEPTSGIVSDRCWQNAPVEKIRVTVREIGNHAFYGSGLSALCIDVQAIDEKAFYQCKNLRAIYSLTAEPPVAPDNSFYRYEGATLYVPAEAAERYKASTSCWRLFPKIEETDFAGLDEMFRADYYESGIGNVVNDACGTFNPDAPFEIYSLSGVRQATENLDSLKPGVYIIRQKNAVSKVVVNVGS